MPISNKPLKNSILVLASIFSSLSFAQSPIEHKVDLISNLDIQQKLNINLFNKDNNNYLFKNFSNKDHSYYTLINTQSFDFNVANVTVDNNMNILHIFKNGKQHNDFKTIAQCKDEVESIIFNFPQYQLIHTDNSNLNNSFNYQNNNIQSTNFYYSKNIDKHTLNDVLSFKNSLHNSKEQSDSSKVISSYISKYPNINNNIKKISCNYNQATNSFFITDSTDFDHILSSFVLNESTNDFKLNDTDFINAGVRLNSSINNYPYSLIKHLPQKNSFLVSINLPNLRNNDSIVATVDSNSYLITDITYKLNQVNINTCFNWVNDRTKNNHNYKKVDFNINPDLNHFSGLDLTIMNNNLTTQLKCQFSDDSLNNNQVSFIKSIK